MLLTVQIDKIYCFFVVGVVCACDLGKEIEQAFQAATFVSEAMLGVTYKVVHFQVCDYWLVSPYMIRISNFWLIN